MAGKLYLIERMGESMDYRYYAEHGGVAGVKDPIGYETVGHARKFSSFADARAFIDNDLPEWGRSCHQVISKEYYDFTWECALLSALLYTDGPITEEQMMPTPNRLRLWRR
jgi:hypothetical protein